jgi:hypothetical protein
MRKKTREKIMEMINASQQIYFACDECGLVFSWLHYLEMHQKETKHKQCDSRSERMAKNTRLGINSVFEHASAVPRELHYPKLIEKKEIIE